MNLMEIINGASGSPLGQMAKKLGVSNDLVGTAVSALLPALTNGIKKNVTKSGGLDGLMSALNTGGHHRYLDDQNAITSESAVKDGNGILGHLLGSKDVSRELASRTSNQTGVDTGILKKMLPMVAGLAMGALKKQGDSSGIFENISKDKSSSSLGGLMGLLDADGDGSPIDDLLGLASKLF